jgi:hypothetical protein
MAYTKTILCLAASRKHQGKCFAGKCLQTGEWIRPVSSRPNEEISAAESRLPDGTQAALLDVLEVPMLEPTPRGHQRENHLIDPARPWRRIRRGTWEEVLQSLDDHAGPLWLNEDASWGHGNNRVSEPTVAHVDRSLLLIRPEGLLVSIGRKGGSFENADRRLVKAHFRHAGSHYTLQVTDPVIEQVMREGADRIVGMGGSVLCLSLGEAFHGHFYKLVAAVLPPGDESTKR